MHLFAKELFIDRLVGCSKVGDIATVSTSMAQFGLIVMPVLIIMNLLSGSTTPIESMPGWLQDVMQLSPSTHFVALS